MPRTDIGGLKFGRWTAISRAKTASGKGGWLCRCECGTERVVMRTTLTKGGSQSCGCRVKEVLAAKQYRHGWSGQPTHNIWLTMRQRCHNPNSRSYAQYGARGIYVCDRWRESFEAFLADMGPQPSPDHSIDRIDCDGPYSPQNCRWATKKTQANNCRRNRVLAYGGKTQTVAQWADELGVSPFTLYQRLSHGWSTEETLTRPIGPNGKRGPRSNRCGRSSA